MNTYKDQYLNCEIGMSFSNLCMHCRVDFKIQKLYLLSNASIIRNFHSILIFEPIFYLFFATTSDYFDELFYSWKEYNEERDRHQLNGFYFYMIGIQLKFYHMNFRISINPLTYEISQSPNKKYYFK